MKVATWNVNSLRVRLEHVIAWLQREQPDVLALQETKLKDEDFPVDAFLEALGYSAIFSGQPAYNGVAIVARERRRRCRAWRSAGFAGSAKTRARARRSARLRLWNLYVPNGQTVDSDKYGYKLDWLAALRGMLAAELAQHPRLLVVGDFNIAPDDRDVHDPVAWQGHVLVHARRARRARRDREAWAYATCFGVRAAAAHLTAGGTIARGVPPQSRRCGSTCCSARERLARACTACADRRGAARLGAAVGPCAGRRRIRGG